MTKKHIIILISIYILVFGFGLLLGEGITTRNKNEEIDVISNALQLTQNKLDDKNIVLQEVQAELDKTIQDLQVEADNSATLNEKLSTITEELSAVQNELGVANTTIADLKDEEYRLVYIGDFKLTHYCNEPYKHICGYGDGLTATGTNVTPGRTIAVDPKVIPYGTKVYIEGYGWRIAEDCGGSVKGNHIDVAVDLHSEAMDMGVKHGGAWILVKQ